MPCMLLLIILITITTPCQVVITEISRDPFGGATSIPGDASHEFVEITNFGVDTFTIDSLYLTDGVEIDAVLPWPSPVAEHPRCITGSKLIPPGRTALILDRDYGTALTITPSSKYLIRENTVLLTTEDSDLGNALAGDDGVLLYKGSKTAISHLVWCAADSSFSGTQPPGAKIVLTSPGPGREGVSIVPTAFLFNTIRYGFCADSVTPGFFELLKNDWFAEWRLGEPDTAKRSFPCSLACIKAGALPASPLRWSVTMQSSAGARTAAEGPCIVAGNRGSAANTLPIDSVSYSLHLFEQSGETIWQLDVSPLFTPLSPIKINEIFPRATPGEPEWIELSNVSPMPINCKNWTIGNSESFDTITSADIIIAPGDFIVLSADGALFSQRYPARQRLIVPSHWHALDNYTDTIFLRDGKGRIKETVCYRSDWFTDWNRQSLERISMASPGTDRASWRLAASPTPGQPSGAPTNSAGSQPVLTIGPKPFTPNGDGRDDFLSITVETGAAASASLSVYGFSGRKLRGFPSPLVPRILWNGRQDNGAPAPAGPFFVVLETRSASGNVMFTRKRGVLWR